MTTTTHEEWTPIQAPPHKDAYTEFMEGEHRFETVKNGQRTHIEVRNECVYGCGHCGIVFKTREELRRVQCQKD